MDDFHLYDFADDVQSRCLAAFYACVDYVDDCIGDLIDGLSRAGLLENTYVIYASDHGEMGGEHGMWSKRSYYDASARVPLLVTGPDIPKGRTVSSPVELLDLFPTFCELAGIPTPGDIDGESLASLLTGQCASRQKKYARCELLGTPDPVMFRMARDERWKYVEFPEFRPVLFDLANDPGENKNLLSSGTAPADCPIEELGQTASDGVSWEEVFRIREEETACRLHVEPRRNRGPVQYQLEDGRIVDGDSLLYEGLSQSGNHPRPVDKR